MKTKSLECLKCRKEISLIRIAISWPTKITCRSCSNQHYYRFGHIVGVLYFAFLLPPMFLPINYSGNFANVQNGIHSMSILQAIVQFGGMFVVFLVVGLTYANIMKKYFTLYAKKL